MLKGTAVIELTDTKTGATEVIRHDNLITNAVNDILEADPLNLRLDAGLELRSRFFPIVGNLIAGILLFEEPLTEDAAQYYAPGDNTIVGYSSMAVSPNTDVRRGSLNQSESGSIDGGTGYRFVFDFATSQGNGQIAALALTSPHMGACGYSSAVYNDHSSGSGVAGLASNHVAFRCVGEESWSVGSVQNSKLVAAITTIDIEHAAAYAVYPIAAKSIGVYRFDLLTDSVGLLKSTPFRNKAPELFATLNTTEFLPAFNATSTYVSFVDGGDGYIWGFCTSDNVSVGATIQWLRISKADWSFTEGTWSLPESVYAPGTMGSLSSTSTYGSKCHCLVHKGHAYFRKADYYGVVVVDTENPSDVTVLKSSNYLSAYHITNAGFSLFNVLGDAVYTSGAHIVDGKLYTGYPMTQNYYVPGLFEVGRPNLRHGLMVFGFSGGTSNTATVRMYIDNSYLATINNLETPVVKTADKTMKITYILREE